MVKIEILPGKINLVIKDDGMGFIMDQSKNSSKRDCFGLLGMRERTQILKGEIIINSAPGQGTMINISVPLD